MFDILFTNATTTILKENRILNGYLYANIDNYDYSFNWNHCSCNCDLKFQPENLNYSNILYYFSINFIYKRNYICQLYIKLTANISEDTNVFFNKNNILKICVDKEK